MRCRITGHLQELSFIWGKLGLTAEFQGPQDAIQWGPDFVAHVGQKLALGAGRRLSRAGSGFCQFLRLAQFSGPLVDQGAQTPFIDAMKDGAGQHYG